MKIGKTLKNFLADAEKSDSYWFERAKLDFAVRLEKQRVARKLPYVAIAKKIGTSAAYITKVFRGDSNVTIETMVKLARATGGQLDIQIVDSTSAPVRWSAPASMSNQAVRLTLPSTVIQFPTAANRQVIDDVRLAA